MVGARPHQSIGRRINEVCAGYAEFAKYRKVDLLLTLKCSEAFSFRTPTWGSAFWIPALPQTSIIGSRSRARHVPQQ